jgi:hypothetical protein
LSLDERASTETEQRLEELLVASPDLLAEGLNIVARQLPTDAGFPDLLGVDQDGRLVVLELKRGTLTRGAVAQVLDYGSDLGERDLEELARLIEEHSGQAGVGEIEDFLDWHGREYPNGSDALKKAPRMILVGLGVDDRAKRIVNFLAEAGVDIHLLTFHAFELEGRLILAKQVETVPPSAARVERASGSKEEKRAILLALAEQQGVKDLLTEVADFIAGHSPFYRWPGKTAYSFLLSELTEKGTPTYRSYVTLYVQRSVRGVLLLTLAPRAVDTAPEAVATFVQQAPKAKKLDSSWAPVQAEITAKSWPDVRGHVEELLRGIVLAWEQRSRAAEAEERGDEQVKP